MSSINTVDLVFFGLTLIFVLTAFLRGFVKEVFALLNWIAAFTLSHLLAPYASKILMFYTTNTLVADIATRTILFVLIFVIVMLSTGSLSKSIKGKIPEIFDRSLGVLFGIVKTLLIFGIVYSAMLNVGSFMAIRKDDFTAESFKPRWLVKAKSYNLIKISGKTVDPIVKIFLNVIIKNFEKNMPEGKKLEDAQTGVALEEGVEDSLITGLDTKINEIVGDKTDKTESDTSSANKGNGYSKKDIQKMDHLIEIVK